MTVLANDILMELDELLASERGAHLARALTEVRNEALEEAAKVAAGHRIGPFRSDAGAGIAAAIRALKNVPGGSAM